jgi:hypothetical protein
MNTFESRPPRPKLAPMALKAFYFIGMAAIVGWSLSGAGPVTLAEPHAESAIQVQMPDGEAPASAVEAPASAPSPRHARNWVKCEGCGVIESVRRIDTRDEIMEWCAIGDTAGTRVPGNLVNGGDRDIRKFRVTTRHQIVVRFRDGTRHVFNEDSPRTLREGDRIQFIAGSTGANG